MIDSFQYGCRNSHTLNLARELNHQGIPATAVLTDMPKQDCREYSRYYSPGAKLFAPKNPKEINRLARKLGISLIHLQCQTLLPLATGLSDLLGLPFGITCRGTVSKKQSPLLNRAAFIIASDAATLAALKPKYPQTIFIPEGVDLQEFQPPPRRDSFVITFIGEQGEYTFGGYHALLKAAAIAGMPVQIICLQTPPIDVGQFQGWPPGRSHLLSGSQVVIGCGRALLEGMACGNAALIMGLGYRGILDPATLPPPELADLSGTRVGGEEPCYRTIFYDLSRLWNDPPCLIRLQEQGRRMIRENYDLRLTAERTVNIYSKQECK